ncbi:copper amine oxidase [Cantharellus anzutake]|uniref:copper amine oxidase n=1 Tax=Cantharellus anzutake TaxID=1750568 RepID=UPI0019066B83|nr:copper amine oxidase [Cantharellus anzutake]KAF8340462.1 copper amine oxidase [Cantharellus anzutake]
MAPLIPETKNADAFDNAKESAKATARRALFHPLDELDAAEIASISLAVREYSIQQNVKSFKFISSGIIHPPKRDVLAWLGIPTAPGKEPAAPRPASILRRAETDFIDVVTGCVYNATLTLAPNGTWVVDGITKLPEGTQPQISAEELLESEVKIRADPEVQRLAAEVGIKPEEIYADGWAIGYDERFPNTTRLQQCLLFARFKPDSNLYAHPLDFFPVLNDTTGKVIHIDFAPHRSKETGELSSDTTAPPPLDAPNYGLSRERIPPPLTPYEYLPELVLSEESKRSKEARESLKTLRIEQPDGVSFKMIGNQIEWQKWKLHVAFNGREGLIISTVTYNDDGEVRPIIYRMSIAEMVVPYAAPEHPHPRKFAFDVGEYGMGAMANDLTLGCDCLGTIHYLPGAFVGHSGEPIKLKRAICIHEEDAGLLWKHTDYRKNGRSMSVRSRKLTVSMIATVANYEYCFYYNFYQDGTIELETRLTGVLNVYVTGKDEPSPHGSIVAPQIQAQYHQHIFSLRLDPMIDGLDNSVLESNLHQLDAPTGSTENYAGNGWYQKTSVVQTPDNARDYEFETDRRWTIVNPSRKHYASGMPAGYTIGAKGGAIRMLAKPDSWVAKRSGFAGKSLWVVRDEEGKRLFPSGKYVPQTVKAPLDSIGEWAKDGQSVDNEDILLFLTFGKPEDWPVMPVEHLRLTLKPVNFFKWSPAIDVRPENDNHSKLAFQNGATENGTNGTSNGQDHLAVESCCSA